MKERMNKVITGFFQQKQGFLKIHVVCSDTYHQISAFTFDKPPVGFK